MPDKKPHLPRHEQYPTRNARVVGGPNSGLLVPVTDKGDGDYEFTDVLDVAPYTFDPDAWEFRYTPSE